MDQIEQMAIRMSQLRPEIPCWAKAEQMERYLPQAELWSYADGSFVKTESKSVAQRLMSVFKRIRMEETAIRCKTGAP